MSGRDEQPKRFSVMVEDRPFMKTACGTCYRYMSMIYSENGNSITFNFSCPICGYETSSEVLKSEIERIQKSYEVTED